MEIIILLSLAILPFIAPLGPHPGVVWSRDEVRSLDCEWVTAEAGSRQYPGRVAADDPRGGFIERGAVLCQERLMRPGLRADRDELILADLEAMTADLAGVAAAQRPDLDARTWLVEAHYPSASVASKITFAAKNSLVELGLSVSDRMPTLSAGDVDVIIRLAPTEAYPAACRRYLATGSLGADDALLSVILRDDQETILHAGLCEQGQWTWLK